MLNLAYQNSIVISRFLQRHTFWLAVLLHLLIIFCVSVIWVVPRIPEKSPGLYIPSYVYEEKPQQAVEKAPPVQAQAVAKNGLEKREKMPTQEQAQPKPEQRDNQQLQVMNISKTTEPVHLIGDKTIAAPLLTLIGKALTRELIYPKIATDFNIRGTPVVGFLLNPDGTISDAQLVRSSGAGVLDAEAIRAVYSTSPIQHVDRYLQMPRYLVVGIIFG